MPIFAHYRLFGVREQARALRGVFGRLVHFIRLFTRFLPPFFNVFARRHRDALVLPNDIRFSVGVFTFRRTIGIKRLHRRPGKARGDGQYKGGFIHRANRRMATTNDSFICHGDWEGIFVARALRLQDHRPMAVRRTAETFRARRGLVLQFRYYRCDHCLFA